MKYEKQDVGNAVRNSNSIREVARKLGARNIPAYLYHRIKEWNLDISHFGRTSRKYTKEVLEKLAKENTSGSAIAVSLGLRWNGATVNYINNV